MIFRLVGDFSESPDLDIDALLSRLPSPVVLELLIPTELDDSVPATTICTHDDDHTSSIAASDTIYDPDAYHRPDIFPVISANNWYVIATSRYLTMPACFFKLLHKRVYNWWLFAMDCVMTICHRILIGTIQLDDLVRSNLKVDIRVIMQLESIGVSYLMHLPTVHEINSDEQTMHWFFNTTTCDLVYHTLLQPQSANWIGVVEVVTSADNSNITISPVVRFLLEKFSFVIAWVIIELQELTDELYAFGHTVLDLHRIHCVVEFECQIQHYLYDILNGTNNHLPLVTHETAHTALMDWIHVTMASVLPLEVNG
ncbi:hypothetical protein EDC04DRAFT_2613599 [Pisolithus marmoratus]|nr:hypothetical protein EDC04DRAFT_2613599 [Pisolithus marmoratus]